MRVVVNIKDNKFKLEDGAIIRAKDLGESLLLKPILQD